MNGMARLLPSFRVRRWLVTSIPEAVVESYFGSEEPHSDLGRPGGKNLLSRNRIVSPSCAVSRMVKKSL